MAVSLARTTVRRVALVAFVVAFVVISVNARRRSGVWQQASQGASLGGSCPRWAMVAPCHWWYRTRSCRCEARPHFPQITKVLWCERSLLPFPAPRAMPNVYPITVSDCATTRRGTGIAQVLGVTPGATLNVLQIKYLPGRSRIAVCGMIGDELAFCASGERLGGSRGEVLATVADDMLVSDPQISAEHGRRDGARGARLLALEALADRRLV